MAKTPSVKDVLARSQAMLAQHKAEGSKPFAGSSYEKGLSSSKTKPSPTTNTTTKGSSMGSSPTTTTPAGKTDTYTGPSDALKRFSIENAPKPDAPTQGKNGTTESPYYPRYTGAAPKNDYEKYISGDTFRAPQSVEQIQREKMKAAQGEINSLNRYGETLVREQQAVNAERSRQTQSVNTLTGLAGSTEANRTAQVTSDRNNADVKAIRDEVGMKVQSVLSEIRTSAITEAQTQRTNARQDATAITEARAKAEERAQLHAATLAQAGVTIDGLKSTDPESYASLAQNVGGEEILKAMFTLNRSQETVLDKRIEGGSYVIAYQNPLDGKVRIETVDLGLPTNYTKTIDAGDRLLAIPDNWGGDPADLITINKGLTPGQRQSGAGGGGGAGGTYGTDLDAIIGATKATITSKFGQQTFDQQIGRARDEGDKINLVASVVLGKADSATKTDFANQAVSIKNIDKAIKMIDQGVQTGVLQAGAQYTYNVLGKDFDPALTSLNQLITSSIQPYRNSITGAAWGEQEDGEYQMLFGSTKYAPEELKLRLQGVKEIMAGKSAAALNAYVNPLGMYNNPFERGTLASGGDARAAAEAAGYDYDEMIADGKTDEEIMQALNGG